MISGKGDRYRDVDQEKFGKNYDWIFKIGGKVARVMQKERCLFWAYEYEKRNKPFEAIAFFKELIMDVPTEGLPRGVEEDRKNVEAKIAELEKRL